MKEEKARANAEDVVNERLGIFERSYEGQMRILYEIRTLLARKKGVYRWAAWALSKKKEKVAAEAVVKALLYDEFLLDHKEELDREFAARVKAREVHNEMIRVDMYERFGTSGQVWDRAWNPEYQRHYYMDYKTREMLWMRPHICEKCHLKIEFGDVKCFSCDTERSPLNQRLFEQAQPKGLAKRAYHDSNVDDGFRHDNFKD